MLDDPFTLLAETPPHTGGNLRIAHAIPSALSALRANKGRSLLTTLGIIIGVAAVIAIVALGEGASASVASQLSGLGTNVLTIMPGSSSSGGVAAGAGSNTTLKAADATAIASVSGVSAVSPVVSGSAQAIAGNQNWSTRVQAVLPAYAQIEDWTVASGTFFTDQDNTTSNNVAVIGQTVATNLFASGESPVGQSIRIRNVPFTVIGVLTSKGSTAGPGGDQDDTILIPFQTGQVRLFGATSINQVIVQVTDANAMTGVQSSIETLLRERHNIQGNAADDFNIRNNNDLITRVSSVSSTMTMLLGSVAAVSLVVGGIGIMNIMLVSVTERTREVGIRLGIGAQPADVMWQFLVEAVVLAALGGVAGIAVGTGIAMALPVLGWTTVVPWNAIVVSFGVSALIGVFFGLYPARRAALLDPIVALRYD
jgi:putative ABC transport system permease protein